MATLIAGTLLATIGYIFTKKEVSNDNFNDKENIENETPSMNNIYDSQHTQDVDRIVRKKAKIKHDKSKNYNQSGIIPINLNEIKGDSNKVVSSLAGVEMTMDDFKHNNMVPFFGGSIKQNIDPLRTHSTLERYTGVSDLYQNKKEIAPLNDTNTKVGNVYGMESIVDFEQQRMVQPNLQNNTLPFKQIKVGVGLNQGTNPEPTGGFQQDIREFEFDKNVDELRTVTRPKLSYEGRIIDGQNTTMRGDIGELNKNRVERFSELNEDNLFTTVGANTKETKRPFQVIKATNRKDTSTEYGGIAYDNIQSTVRSKIQDTSRQQLGDYGKRNEDKTYIGTEEDDYGKTNILVYSNERDITLTKGYQGNLTTAVKSIIAPLQDLFKLTPKEYTAQAKQPYGNMHAQFPDKLTVYNPNSIAKTTLKEQLIHDQVNTYITPEYNRGPAYDDKEIAKITTRNTLKNEDHNLNLSARTALKTTVYNPNEIAKITTKQTTENNKNSGFISRTTFQEGGGYKTTLYEAPHTHKQFLTDEYKGGIKYTTSGTNVEIYDVPETQKGLQADYEYEGTAISKDKKTMSYSDKYNMIVNDVKEMLLEDRVPTKTGAKESVNANMVNLQPEKLQKASIEDETNYSAISKIYNTLNENVDFTKQKKTYDNYDNTRLDTAILDAYKQNPYVHSLNSVA